MASRTWIKSAHSYSAERFSLLLLQPDEVYFDDYSVTCYFLTEKKEVEEENRRRGRLKVCSHSVIFDPLEHTLPVIKIPYRECTLIEEYRNSGIICKIFQNDVSAGNSTFLVETSQSCQMLENGVVGPYKFVKKKQRFLFQLNFGELQPVLLDIKKFSICDSSTLNDRNTMIQGFLKERYSKFTFKISWLEDLQEKIIVKMAGEKISPLVSNPGRILLTSHRLYFQPFNNAEAEPVLKIHLATLKRVVRRRYILRHIGIEFLTKSGESMFLTLESASQRNELYKLVLEQPGVSVEEMDLESLTKQWQIGGMSNYDYLMALNFLADRSLNDITQYPVFPWVIKDYESDTLDLDNPETFRDLSKPIGTLNEERFQFFKSRYDEMPGKKFLYGTHYSAPAFVLFYLVRTAPEYLLCLQNGQFDHPDRMFHSLPVTWRNVLTSFTDVKELIPEFYEPPANFLLNSQNLNLGSRSNGEKLGDVILPPWAADANDFAVKCRQALECSHVSKHLHKWIDLIFGYKQKGREAIKANNVFHYLSYEGEVDLERISDLTELASYKVHIREFGQTPSQLFLRPHPQRFSKVQVAADYVTTPTSDIAAPSPTSSQDSLSFDRDNLSRNIKNPSSSSSSSSSSCALSWKSLNIVHKMKSHKEEVTSVKMSSDAATVFTTSRDKTLKVHSTSDMEQVVQASLSALPLSSVCLLPDDKTVLVGGWDNQIYCYSVEYGATVSSVYAHDSSVSCLHLQGNILASGSWDSTVKVWSVETSSQPTLTELAEFDLDSEVTCVSITGTGNLVAAGTVDGSVAVWSTDTFTPLVEPRVIHSGSTNSLVFSDDGHTVLSCGADGMFCVWTLEAGGETVNSYTVPDVFRCISTWDDYVIAGGQSGSIHVWSTTLAKPVYMTTSGSGAITCIDVSKDKRMIAVGSEDRCVTLWQFNSKL